MPEMVTWDSSSAWAIPMDSREGPRREETYTATRIDETSDRKSECK